MNISVFIVFLTLPILSLFMWLSFCFFGRKREGKRYSLRSYLPYESMEEVHPSIALAIRVLSIIYIASQIPFYVFLIQKSNAYSTTLEIYAFVISFTSIVSLILFGLTTYVKASLSKLHMSFFAGESFLQLFFTLLLSNYFNLIKKGNMVSSSYSVFLTAISVVLIVLATLEALILVNRKLFSWHVEEEDGIRRRFYLGFAEWGSLFLSLGAYLISLIAVFVISL